MSNPGAAPRAASPLGPRYWLALIAAALVALSVSLAVMFLARARGWPYRPAITFGTYLFVMPLANPGPPGHKRQWIPKFAIAVVGAAVGAAFMIFVSR